MAQIAQIRIQRQPELLHQTGYKNLLYTLE